MNDKAEHYGKLTSYQLHNLIDLQAQQYRDTLLSSQRRYADLKRLNRYENEILSQCGEDGIIEEIFRRIGTTNRHFVEFGAGNGLQNSTAALLLNNWTGSWIEGDASLASIIKSKFAALIVRHRLTLTEAFVTAENIEQLFVSLDVPESFDLLSIDIDGNDYWVWKSIVHYHPRVVIGEYNGRYGATLPWVMKYNPSHRWNGSCYYGASLKSLELLGALKGYSLVGCNLSGVNAFFVQNSLLNDLFAAPFTAENHFEPQRFFLVASPLQANDFGTFETI